MDDDTRETLRLWTVSGQTLFILMWTAIFCPALWNRRCPFNSDHHQSQVITMQLDEQTRKDLRKVLDDLQVIVQEAKQHSEEIRRQMQK